MIGSDRQWRFNYQVVPTGGMELLDEPTTVTIREIVGPAGSPAAPLEDRSLFIHAPGKAELVRSLAKMEFVKQAEPVLRAGVPGAWDAGGVRVGDVVEVEGTYLMVYTGYSADGEAAGIGLATSRDKVNWTKNPEPVIKPGPPGAWNSGEAIHPTALWDNGVYHLWYVGRPRNGDHYSTRFGHTTSLDGIQWEPATPGLGPGPAGAWDEERIGGLDVIKVGEVFFLYYAATTLTPEFKRQIGCALSGDGDTWTKCEANPVLAPRPDIAPFEGNETEEPDVVFLYNTWLMGYTGYGGSQGANFQIGFAYSLDGIQWVRLDETPALPWGPLGAFDEFGTLRPTVLAEWDKVWLWYTGFGPEGSAIGLAVATLN